MSLQAETPLNEIKQDLIQTQHIETLPAQEADAEAGLKRRNVNTQLDDAAELLAQAGGHVEVSLEDSKRVVRLVDVWVCVPMCIVYTIQNMDKSTLSYSAVFNLQAETGLVGSQYSWLTR
jgi:hypothetical protein